MPSSFRGILVLGLLGGLVAASLLAGGVLLGRDLLDSRHDARQHVLAITGGDPDRAEAAFRARGCIACHVIPGIRGAEARVGPELAGFARRAYVAGVLPNGVDNLVRFLMDPPGVDPLTAMPRTGLSEQEARDIAAYLYLAD